MTLGIIDVGTNSIHLLIGVLGLTGKFHVILKERDLTRIGEGGLVDGTLTRKAVRRALEVLRRYASTLKRCRVDAVEAVATSAVREARNGGAFVRQVRKRTGIPLRIISGRQEARLIYLGILQAARLQSTAAIVTIGGGSAQVILGNGGQPHYTASLPLGSARLSQQFIKHDPPRWDEVEALTRKVRKAWAPVARSVRRHRVRQAIGSSATLQQLMEAAYLLTHRRPVRKHQLSITQRALRQMVRWLADSTTEERMQLPGLDPRREDLALPTAIVLLTWMDDCGIRSVRFAPGSLREGLVMDYLIKHHQRRRGLVHPLVDRFQQNGNGHGAASMIRRRPARLAAKARR
jgi:exopolyphosphatase/guanosine-5'-triphosphate,3'-diphosphate pyrophosphatase